MFEYIRRKLMNKIFNVKTYADFIGSSIKNNTVNIFHFVADRDFIKEITASLSLSFYYYDLSDDEVFFQPYTPFFSIMECCKPEKSTIEQYIYQPHRQLFIDYFYNDKVNERKDYPIYEEINYEKKRMRHNITSIITNSDSKNSIFVIYNAQRLPTESLEIIHALNEKSSDKFFVLVYNQNEIYSDSIDQNFINYFNEISIQSNFFMINSGEKSKVECKSIENCEIAKVTRSLRLCRLFLSIDHGVNISENFKTIINENESNKKYLREFSYNSAILNLYHQNHDNSLLFFNNVIEESLNDEISISSLIYLSQLLYEKNDFPSSMKYSKLAMTKTTNTEKKHLKLLSHLMVHINFFRINQKYNFTDFKELIDGLNEEELFCNYIYASLISWSVDQTADEKKIILNLINDAIEKAKELDNEFALSTAFQWKGIFLSQLNETNEAFYYYEKAAEIRDSLGELLPILKIRNGIAYEYLIKAEYLKSFENISLVLEKLDGIKDYTEIVMTLYNLVIVYFYGREYKKALKILQRIFKIMKIFDMKKLPFHSIADLKLIRAFISYQLDDIIYTKVLMQEFIDINKFNTFNRPVLQLLQAIINLSDGNVDKALDDFKKNEKLFYEYCPSQIHYLTYAYMEFAYQLYKYTADGELAKSYWEKGRQISKENNLKTYVRWFDESSYSDITNSHIDFAPLSIKLNFIEYLANQEKLLNQLHKRIRDIQFVNISMEFGRIYSEKIEYSNHITTLINDYLITDAVTIIEKIDNKWQVISSTNMNNQKINEKVFDKLFENSNYYFFNDKKCTTNNEKGSELLFKFDKFELKGFLIINLHERKDFTKEDLNILSIIANNIQSQLLTIKQNEHLIKISTTDQLTKLNNRRALQMKINHEKALIDRYSEGERKFELTVCFIDMDNFKYYNDTFGHAIGDLLINSFADILQEVFRKVDFVSRYGGDEFVILLPETGLDEAITAADRVYKRLAEVDNFIPLIKEEMNRNVDIPTEKRLTCSIGIACNHDTPNISDINSTLENADKALYVAKNKGKGCAVLSKDIPDEEKIKINPSKSIY